MRLPDVSRPYFLGIGGIGTSAIARYFLASGRRVRGTDLVRSTITDQLTEQGAEVAFGQSPKALPVGTDLLVYTDAAPPDHPLRRDAASRGIPSRSYAEMLGAVLARSETRAVVTGTNGKTTTSALAGWLLEESGLDPTLVIGSLVPQLGGNFRLGSGDVALCEGDEYLGHIFRLDPTVTLVTNVSYDHPDHFADLDEVVGQFQSFLNRLPYDGLAILNADDQTSRGRLRPGRRSVSFSAEGAEATLVVAPGQPADGRRALRVSYRGRTIGETSLALPGAHNVSNAAGALLLALELGSEPRRALGALEAFRGVWRRFERIAVKHGAQIISDYAHHPVALRRVIEATREWYPGCRVVVAFQPHHRARLRAFERAFAEVLTGDVNLVTEVYTVSGREGARDADVSAQELVTAVRRAGRTATFVPSLAALRERLKRELEPKTVVLVLGAGDIDEVARTL